MPPAPLTVSVALFAVLVVAAVLALLQLRKTLAAVESALATTERRLGPVLEELGETLARVNRTSKEIERLTTGLTRAATTFPRLGLPLHRLTSSLRIARAVRASIGPMLAAAIRGALNREDQGGHERHRLPVTREIP